LKYWKILLVCLAGAGLTIASCSHPGGTGTTTGTGGSNGSGGSGNCPAGTEGCPCNGSSCDQGLQCAADINTCVTTSSGTGGGLGTGGNVATGGSPGTGGDAATGGSLGTGGTPSTGGSPGTGGTGTGGTSALGGSPGTGGTSSGTNLIINGDFSQSDTNWGVPNGSPTTKGVQNGQYCVTLNSGSGQVVVGWGGMTVSASLSANVNYTFSFQASTTSALSAFDTHIGSAVAVPAGSLTYPVDSDVGNDNIQNGSQTFTHMFSITTADPQAGVAFLISASNGNPTVCVDNVSLTAN
jgi:hypothetical protein